MFNDSARLGRRLRALCLCLVTLCTWVLTLPVAAQTSTTVNNLTVLAPGEEGTDWKWNGNDFEVLRPGEFTFSSSGSTTSRVTVKASAAGARLVLNNLSLVRNIYSWTGEAMILEKDATAEMVLTEGSSNYMCGGMEGSSLRIDLNATLTVSGTGYLKVEAKTGPSAGAGHGAAIQVRRTGTLIVNSGTVEAISQQHSNGCGAAIGSNQYNSDGDGAAGTVIVNGGKVIATAGQYSAAIGGGGGCSYGSLNRHGADGGTLIVNGGEVVANGRIGAGYGTDGVSDKANGGSIEINGGTVTTTAELGSGTVCTTAGSITVSGGSLSTPTITVADGAVTVNSNVTLRDSVTFNNKTVTVTDGTTLTLADQASINGGILHLGGTSASVTGNGACNLSRYEADVFLIYNLPGLKYFRDLINNSNNASINAKLMADIDLSGENWWPIGYYSDAEGVMQTKYCGTFDGNAHVVKNLYINTDRNGDFGLFGRVWRGQVKDLGVVNATIIANGTTCHRAGVIVGTYVDNSPMQNCYSAGSISFEGDFQMKGGVVAELNRATLQNCYSSYENIYSLNSAAGVIEDCEASLPADCHTSGAVAYRLNAHATGGITAWGQLIGTDEHPVVQTAENTLYNNGRTGGAGSEYMSCMQRMKFICPTTSITLPDDVIALDIANVEERVLLTPLPSQTLPANTPAVLFYTGNGSTSLAWPAVTEAYTNSDVEQTDYASRTGWMHYLTTAKVVADDEAGKIYEMSFSDGMIHEIRPIANKLSAGNTLNAGCFFLQSATALSEDHYYHGAVTPIGRVNYGIVSEEERTCAVTGIAYLAAGNADYKLHLPEQVTLNGNDYKLTQLGAGSMYDMDGIACWAVDHDIHVYFPPQMQKVYDMAFPGVYIRLAKDFLYHFTQEDVPELLPSEYYPMPVPFVSTYVPYGAEAKYAAQWSGGNTSKYTSARTELDIANGSVEVTGNIFVQHLTEGDLAGAIDETLLLTNHTSANGVKISGGSEESPVRVAIKDVEINFETKGVSKQSCPMDIANGAWAELIVQGNNYLIAGTESAGIHVSPATKDGSQAAGNLRISALSTGELFVWGGTEVDGLGGGAGIGGHEGENAGNIDIYGGRVTAYGVSGAAALGGASSATPTTDYAMGRVYLYGGTITGNYGNDRLTEGYSVQAAVGSVDETVDFFISDQATFIGNVNAHVNTSTTASLYRGSSDAQQVKLSTVSSLQPNELAFTNVPLNGVQNVVTDGTCADFKLYDGLAFYSPQSFTATSMVYERRLYDNDFQALYVPFAVSVADLTDCDVYAINNFHQRDTDGDDVFDELTLEVLKAQPSQTLLPNHPYLFKYKGVVDAVDGTLVPFVLHAVQVAATETPLFSCSSMNFDYTFRGSYAAMADASAYYALGVDDEGRTALVHPTNGLRAQRWYMEMTPRTPQFGGGSMPAPRTIRISDGSEPTTGIGHATTAHGHVTTYGLDGKPVRQAGKGVYIERSSDGTTRKVIR